MENYLRIVKERVNFREGISVLLKMLSAVYFEENISTKELARGVKLPIPIVTAIKKEFIHLNIMEQKNGIQLTMMGREYVEKELEYTGMDYELFNDLKNHKTNREKLIQKLSREYEEIYQNRPTVDVTIDQAKAEVETSFRRAMLCLERETLIGKKILCVGDDDLVSISLGLLLKELFPNKEFIEKKIVVFDIDKRFVQYINEIAVQYELPVECLNLDLKGPLPITYANSFDCFFTDPPYTMEGLTLFLSRGVSALKKEKGVNAFLSFGQKPINETLLLQEIILNHGFAISQVLQSFNKYEGASLLGNVSQMIVLESTDELKTIVQMDESFVNKMYTADFREHRTQYKCKNCMSVFKVGKKEKYSTIEILKEKGCCYCGNKVFTQLKVNHNNSVSQSQKKTFLGEHLLADFYGCNNKVLGDVKLIKKIMDKAAIKANASIVTEEFHNFSPWGVSGAIIIKESHLTIHTWPEYGYAAVDVFTCGDTLNLWLALEYIKDKLESNNMEYNDVKRGRLRDGKVIMLK